jgi:hypothetical protein
LDPARDADPHLDSFAGIQSVQVLDVLHNLNSKHVNMYNLLNNPKWFELFISNQIIRVSETVKKGDREHNTGEILGASVHNRRVVHGDLGR